MATPDLYRNLPTSNELPDSDDIPVDNEDQNFIPNALLFLLQWIWQSRNDWFFGVDMAIYHTTGANPRVPVVPDAFLSLGVERRKQGKSRKSYVVWEENGIVPILAIEIVSQTPGGEYDEKAEIYAKLGVLYYVIYNPDFWQRVSEAAPSELRHQPFEVYRLVNDSYQLQIGEPFWMPEIGLGIGRVRRTVSGIELELLSWYNQQGSRYLSLEERAERAERLAARLRELGEDPEQL